MGENINDANNDNIYAATSGENNAIYSQVELLKSFFRNGYVLEHSKNEQERMLLEQDEKSHATLVDEKCSQLLTINSNPVTFLPQISAMANKTSSFLNTLRDQTKNAKDVIAAYQKHCLLALAEAKKSHNESNYDVYTSMSYYELQELTKSMADEITEIRAKTAANRTNIATQAAAFEKEFEAESNETIALRTYEIEAFVAIQREKDRLLTMAMDSK